MFSVRESNCDILDEMPSLCFGKDVAKPTRRITTESRKGFILCVCHRCVRQVCAPGVVYLSGKVVEAEHKSPVEVSFPGQRVEVDVSLLFFSFQSFNPAAAIRTE